MARIVRGTTLESQSVTAAGSDSERSMADAEKEIRELEKKLQEERREATLVNAELHVMIETCETLEARSMPLESLLAEAIADVDASRSRRKEMARVIANRNNKIAKLTDQLQQRNDDIAELRKALGRGSWRTSGFMVSLRRLAARGGR